MEAPKFVSIVIDAKGATFLNETPVNAEELAAGLAKAAEASRDTEVQLRADESVPYGQVVQVMGMANKAGLSRIGFVTEAPASGPAATAPAR